MLSSASVHYCDSEFTSINWFSKASCEHEKEMHCKSHCCKKITSHFDIEFAKSKECCETQQFVYSTDQNIVENVESKVKIYSLIFAISFLKSFYSEGATATVKTEFTEHYVQEVDRAKIQVYII